MKKGESVITKKLLIVMTILLFFLSVALGSSINQYYNVNCETPQGNGKCVQIYNDTLNSTFKEPADPSGQICISNEFIKDVLSIYISAFITILTITFAVLAIILAISSTRDQEFWKNTNLFENFYSPLVLSLIFPISGLLISLLSYLVIEIPGNRPSTIIFFIFSTFFMLESIFLIEMVAAILILAIRKKLIPQYLHEFPPNRE